MIKYIGLVFMIVGAICLILFLVKQAHANTNQETWQQWITQHQTTMSQNNYKIEFNKTRDEFQTAYAKFKVDWEQNGTCSCLLPDIESVLKTLDAEQDYLTLAIIHDPDPAKHSDVVEYWKLTGIEYSMKQLRNYILEKSTTIPAPNDSAYRSYLIGGRK